jgi:hypothetical protein
MVVCVAEGAVTLSDLMEYFAALRAAGAWNYRRIVDLTGTKDGMSEAEVAEVAARVKKVRLLVEPAPMALVTGSGGNDAVVAKIRIMLRPGRRMREFATIHEAREWLDRIARMPRPAKPRRSTKPSRRQPP